MSEEILPKSNMRKKVVVISSIHLSDLCYFVAAIMDIDKCLTHSGQIGQISYGDNFSKWYSTCFVSYLRNRPNLDKNTYIPEKVLFYRILG